MKFKFTDHFWETRTKPLHEITADQTVSIVQTASAAFVQPHRRGRYIFQKRMLGHEAPARVVASATTSDDTPDLTIIPSYFVSR